MSQRCEIIFTPLLGLQTLRHHCAGVQIAGCCVYADLVIRRVKMYLVLVKKKFCFSIYYVLSKAVHKHNNSGSVVCGQPHK